MGSGKGAKFKTKIIITAFPLKVEMTFCAFTNHAEQMLSVPIWQRISQSSLSTHHDDATVWRVSKVKHVDHIVFVSHAGEFMQFSVNQLQLL